MVAFKSPTVGANFFQEAGASSKTAPPKADVPLAKSKKVLINGDFFPVGTKVIVRAHAADHILGHGEVTGQRPGSDTVWIKFTDSKFGYAAGIEYSIFARQVEVETPPNVPEPVL